MQLALAAALATVVAWLAYRAHALSTDGAAAAAVVGTMIFGASGWTGAAVLLAFFVPSALLSRLNASDAPRNAWQVLANGGVAALCAILATRFGMPASAAFAGAFAAAAADTWGTEIGTRFGGAPVSILTFRRIAVGRSGGITFRGTLATVAGSTCVAVVAAALHVGPLLSVALGGATGALFDSALGASVQALRWCPSCARECETLLHDCGARTALRRGVSWIENDAVNFAATLFGAVVAAALTVT